MNYNVDFKRVVNFLLPSYKRKTKRVSWLYRLLKYIRTIHSDFLIFNTTINNDLKYAPGYKIQVEQMLVDEFGEGITITNNLQTVRPFFAYTTDDLRNIFTFKRDHYRNLFAHETDAYNFNHKNFTVNVPAILSADLDMMRAAIQKYNRAGMNFEIIVS